MKRLKHALIAHLLTFSATLTGVTVPAFAHHSNAPFDLERSITIDGVVADYEWVNPHVYLYVETADEAGGTAVWEIEASPPALMARRGWSRETFAIGDRITVEASPARDVSRHMALIRTVRKADGPTFVVNSNDPSAAGASLAVVPPTVPAPTLEGTWQTMLGAPARAFIFGPASWALTDEGSAAVQRYDDTESPAADCVAYTAPFSMVFPDTKSIEIDERVVTVRSSLENAERTIHVDVATHDAAPFSNQGHSIGRWEGETLVVDTARFEARQNGGAFMLPSSRAKRLSERFSLNDDRTMLVYRFELEDPEYLAEPVVGEVRWAHSPDTEFAAGDCDLENARRYLGDAAP